MQVRNLNFVLHSVAVLAVTTLLSACSSDLDIDTESSENSEKMTLTVYQPGSETRVGFDKNGNGYWHSNDKIGVWSSDGQKYSSFELIEGDGESKAIFEEEKSVLGKKTPLAKYVVYPERSAGLSSLQGDTLTYFPYHSYYYDEDDSFDQTFFPSDKNGHNFNMPMIGTISDNNVVTFKHIGGVICIRIDKMPARKGTVKVTELYNKLVGSYKVCLTDVTPEIKTYPASNNKTTTFLYERATKDSVGIFYLPVATGKYNLTIEVSGAKCPTTTAAVTVKRGGLQVVNVITDASVVDSPKDDESQVGNATWGTAVDTNGSYPYEPD